MSRIAVTEGVANYFRAGREKVDDLLDYVTAPYGMSPADFTQWHEKQWEAKQTREQYVAFIRKVCAAVWLPPVHRYLHLNSPIPSDVRECTPQLREKLWGLKRIEGRSWIPIVCQRKSQQTHMKYGLVTSIEGGLVLTMDVERPFRVKRLSIPRWRWSEESGYECPSSVRLTKATAKLDISELKRAAEDAVKAVADFYLPAHLRPTAA
jgi:hypothetical protein